MNALSLRACGRILWREAAEQYAFCIGMFALLITMQASLATMESFDMIRPPTVAFGFGMALFMTAIYAAASCALMLTAETDAGTFTFQRTRPVGWLTYLWGKLSWVVASTLLLGIVAWLETSVWLGVFPGPRDASLAFGVTGVGIIEGLAWGLIAALLVREPLRAVVAGIAMASLVAWITVVINHWATGGGTVAVTTAYFHAAVPRLIVAAVVLAVGLRLVRVWYRTGQPLWPWSLPKLAEAAAPADIASQWNAYAEPSRGRATRLVWHAWRQIRTQALIYWGLCLATIVFLAVASNLSNGDSLRSLRQLAAMAAFVFAGLSALLAGYTFGADQRAKFLQLARDGLSPWEIWLSRLVVMAAVLLPPTVFIYVSYWFALSNNNLVVLQPLAALLVVLGYVSVLTIGQACSMFVRSRIIALLAAPVAVGCFAFWVGMGVFWAGLGWRLGVVPLLVALLIGSRLLAGTRLRQDNSWRAMGVPAVLIAVAVVFTYQAFAHHRVSEVRPYDSVTQIDTQMVPPTPRTFEYLSSRDVSSQEQTEYVMRQAWGSSPQEQIHYLLLSEDHDSPSKLVYSLQSIWRANSGIRLGRRGKLLIGTYDNMLLAETEMDHALRQAASRSGIANDRLRACIDFLEDWPSERTRHAEWLAVDCQRDMAWLREGKRSEVHGAYTRPLPWRYRWLWFERVRAMQVVDRAYRIGADRAEVYETALLNDQLGAKQGGFGGIWVSNPAFVTSQDILPYDPSRPIWYQTANHMVLETSMWEFPDLRSLALTHWQRYESLYTTEAQRRGTILYLALRMYYNDKGDLPESLQTLVEEEYLGRLPLVPIACETFFYEPEGTREKPVVESVDQYARYSVTGRDTSFLLEHDSEMPFLWCPFEGNQTMNPGSVEGMFIDLDFVKN